MIRQTAAVHQNIDGPQSFTKQRTDLVSLVLMLRSEIRR